MAWMKINLVVNQTSWQPTLTSMRTTGKGQLCQSTRSCQVPREWTEKSWLRKPRVLVDEIVTRREATYARSQKLKDKSHLSKLRSTCRGLQLREHLHGHCRWATVLMSRKRKRRLLTFTLFQKLTIRSCRRKALITLTSTRTTVAKQWSCRRIWDLICSRSSKRRIASQGDIRLAMVEAPWSQTCQRRPCFWNMVTTRGTKIFTVVTFKVN